ALPTQCPLCGGEITVTRLCCSACDVTIEGQFEISRFLRLSAEHLAFVETFVRCEGKLSRMEGELGLSYPTIRSRLHDVIRALGYEPGKEDLSSTAKLGNEERLRILDALEQGHISAEKAMALLQGRLDEDGN
ncbi:MAG: DUF2089 domain-containing protein, partial [Anaerolineae bacterium]|nr:DUF2089 domain-containing protein [Thermoflexales bacterium]MDW8407397.1 DUF2089 domain-containing protein [Anaerolineae bacterium]